MTTGLKLCSPCILFLLVVRVDLAVPVTHRTVNKQDNTQYGKQTQINNKQTQTNNKQQASTNKQTTNKTNKQTQTNKQTNSKHASSKWSTTSWCNYCLCALPLLLLVLESLVCLVHPFFPGRERGRETMTTSCI